jgi:hypothetical protein
MHELNLQFQIDTEQGTCKALIRYSLDRASNMKDNWVLGRPFFRSFCVSFGYKKDDTMKLENPHLGLATNLS